jgi:hypothetical protein
MLLLLQTFKAAAMNLTFGFNLNQLLNNRFKALQTKVFRWSKYWFITRLDRFHGEE